MLNFCFCRQDDKSTISGTDPSSGASRRERAQANFPPSPQLPHRPTQVRTAPFNPANLGGPMSAPDVYTADEGVYRVNIAMFDPPERFAHHKHTNEPGPSTSRIEPTYIIPRPVIDLEPAVIHGRRSPIQDYISDDSSVTHM